MEVLGNEPVTFLLKFTFCIVNMAQLLILRNIMRYKVIVSENFILLVKRQKRVKQQEKFTFSVSENCCNCK